MVLCKFIHHGNLARYNRKFKRICVFQSKHSDFFWWGMGGRVTQHINLWSIWVRVTLQSTPTLANLSANINTAFTSFPAMTPDSSHCSHHSEIQLVNTYHYHKWNFKRCYISPYVPISQILMRLFCFLWTTLKKKVYRKNLWKNFA